LFRTAPVGGPAGQADYLNAVLVVTQVSPADPATALWLLGELQGLERHFARQRRIRWGPRSLDLDLLWWGELSYRNETLELPHPRLLERAFVLAPLAAVNPSLRPPGTRTTSAELLAQVQRATPDPAPKQLPGCSGWPE
jgi:2-amino-4-hydroxy-6-hydroxymethyldihydropteridine diphosphokinase